MHFRGITAHPSRDLLDWNAEHIVEQEGGAFQGRALLESKHQSECQIIDSHVPIIRPINGVRQLWGNTLLGTRLQRFKAKRHHQAVEGGRWGLNFDWLKALPSPRYLVHNTLGLLQRAEDLVSEAD